MIPFPDKKYEIIYPDPPWDYEYIGKNFHKQFSKYKNSFKPVDSACDHYSTMSIEEIKALPVYDLSDKNCLCFIWVTSPFMKEGIQILECWGFEYKTIAFVWNKLAVNPGFYTMSEIELCLVGKKKGGSIPKPRGARNIKQLYETLEEFPQFYSERRTVHSKKPDEFRNRITKMFPYQLKIELFARQKYDGWDCWGNEVNDSSSIKQQKIINKGFFD